MDAQNLPLEWIVVGLAMVVVGIFAGIWFGQMLSLKKSRAARADADSVAADAEEKGQKTLDDLRRQGEEERSRLVDKADQEYERQLKKHEREFSKRRHDFDRRDRRLDSRQSALDRKFQDLEKREAGLSEVESHAQEIRDTIEKRQQEIEEFRTAIKDRCEAVSGFTQDEAKRVLLETLEADVRQDAAALVRKVEAESKEQADKKARQIITLAIQRCAADQVTETSVSVVQLPSDDLKGRIIGREGRNIRALESATGCNIIVDDTPEAVVLSCFDPVRREVARLTLEKLLADGRIHPGRIEDIVAKVEKELAEHIRQMGEQTVFDLGLADMHPELTKVLGRLRYRTSYGQNILSHSVEVANLCAYMAAELGADPEPAKRAGLLHDIGKAMTHEKEGTHALNGAELCKKYNESPGVVHAIAAHHNEVDPRTIIAVLVQGADAISSARPGARRETLESYVKRLKKLEEIAQSFHGVTKCYAMQAGREVRIMVEPTEINDNEASLLARNVSKQIEKDVDYPGQIKIMVCREVRSIEYAK
jgi:ribonuclease Y